MKISIKYLPVKCLFLSFMVFVASPTWAQEEPPNDGPVLQLEVGKDRRQKAALEALLPEYADAIIKLQQKARTDDLTQLGNYSVLKEQRQRFTPNQESYFTVTFDIDHFKKVNDTYGHAVGDVVLKRIGEILNESLRSTDFIDDIIRSGGEEFIMILKMTNKNDVLRVVERIQKQIKSEKFKKNLEAPDSELFSVKISVGIAQLKKDETFDELLRRADNALYKAKKTRDTVVFSEFIQNGCEAHLIIE